jgi:hypothetical protein
LFLEKSGNPGSRDIFVAGVGTMTGLPDFSWNNIPTGKDTKFPLNYQMAVIYSK